MLANGTYTNNFQDFDLSFSNQDGTDAVGNTLLTDNWTITLNSDNQTVTATRTNGNYTLTTKFSEKKVKCEDNDNKTCSSIGF